MGAELAEPRRNFVNAASVRDDLRWNVEMLEQMIRHYREWFNDEAWFQHLEAAQTELRAAIGSPIPASRGAPTKRG